jgi:RNA polymerase sigma-70 factor (ECF subfamily)
MNSKTVFEREALTHIDAVHNFAFQLCRDQQRSRDLVQETMLKACRYFHTYQHGTNCRAWLFQICKNAYINQYRRKHIEPVTVDFSDNPSEAENSAGGDEIRGVQVFLQDDRDAIVHNSCLSDEVITALRAIPLDYQTAVVLCDIEGHTYEEVADFMQVPVGTIRSRIHRGRKMLAGLLAKYARDLRWPVVPGPAS